ncbi:MAG: hypothetical protein ACP5I4_01040 [Oceanipulchritudo sp.]
MKVRASNLLVGILALGYPFLAVPALHAAEDNARITVILVEADGGEGGVDSALRPYAGTLQRLFRFNSYRQVSRKSLRIEVPGEGSVGLGGGQALSLRAEEGGRRGLMADLTWTRGSKRLLHTRIQLRPESPAVLGGPRSGKDGGSYLLILQLE